MQGIILAAGRGSRLYPLTGTRSKAMLPILGRPIVERIMEDMAANGIDDFVIVISPEDREIIQYFHSQSRFGSNVRFVYQPQRLGMADALGYAAPLITGDFVLSACDSLMAAADYRRMIGSWRTSRGLNALLAVMPVEPEKVSSVGVVEMDGPWVTRIVEKPALDEALSHTASLPLYCFSYAFLDYLPRVPVSKRGERELQDAIQMMIDHEGGVRGLFVDSRLTLTNPADLLMINRHYLAQDSDLPELSPRRVGPNTQLITPLYIESETFIGANCVIGPNVYVEWGCRIGEGATVRDSVLLREATVPDGQTVVGQIVSPDSFTAPPL